MGKLFGTDGIRGVANKDLTSQLAFDIGKACAIVIKDDKHHNPTILIGMDTRISGQMFESSLTAGLCSVGANVVLAGVIPTPAISYLVQTENYDAGIVISASHNPFLDNGIKIFDSNGYKLSDELESKIEVLLERGLDDFEYPIGKDIGRKIYLESANEKYINFLKSTIDNTDLSNLKIVLDCANGATYKSAPRVFKDLNANLITMHNNPNGININKDCGSTHMESLIDEVKRQKANIGIAYDGDGDRCLLVDENGSIIDGDQIMSICGNYLLEKGNLKNNCIVATVMSNLGLHVMGEKTGIKIEKTNVGDRFVLEKMLSGNYNFGGEQSGHIIFLDYNTTGDGILTSLQVLKQIKSSGKTLSELNSKMDVFPQVLLNAKVSNTKKQNYLDYDEIKTAIEELENSFLSEGRVLIRPSGTEPLIRVMIEGKDIQKINEAANKLVTLIELHLN